MKMGIARYCIGSGCGHQLYSVPEPNEVCLVSEAAANSSATIVIRAAGVDDCEQVTSLDALITGLRKQEYWRETFARYIDRDSRHVLVAESGSGVGGFAGFILGEVRAWEFGSKPCGWIVAIGVDPEQRVHGIGERLFNAMCEKLEEDGVETVRTMIARADHLNMAFFRAQGMMAGPFIELEKPVAWKFEHDD